MIHKNFVKICACLVITMQLTACQETQDPLQVLDRLEQRYHASGFSTGTLAFHPNNISAEKLLELIKRLEIHKIAPKLLGKLWFSYYLKTGQRNKALIATRFFNKQAARKIAQIIKHRNALKNKIQNLNVKEQAELQYLKTLSECERSVYSGQFKPMTGNDFCKIVDSGILNFLPLPSRLLSGAKLAPKVISGLRLKPLSALKSPLKKVAIGSHLRRRYHAKRLVLQKQIQARKNREDKLMQHLADLQWNIVLELSSSR